MTCKYDIQSSPIKLIDIQIGYAPPALHPAWLVQTVDDSSLVWTVQASSCCSQFSTPPPALSSRPGETTTSPYCSGTFTGCASWSASSSGYMCWSTSVCTAWHRRTSPTTSSWLLLLVPAINSGLLTLRLWWSGPPDARRSATAHFPWQLHAPGTASRQLLGMRRHFFPSGAAWRHGCLNWHWRDTDLILRLHFISFAILVTL